MPHKIVYIVVYMIVVVVNFKDFGLNRIESSIYGECRVTDCLYQDLSGSADQSYGHVISYFHHLHRSKLVKVYFFVVIVSVRVV